MQYLLLIYGNEGEWASRPESENDKEMKAYMEFTQQIAATGNLRGGEALHPTTMATTVRVRSGKTQTTDGPFAETREQLGGYYLIDAKDLDEAIAISARIPGAKSGSIEVRPIMPTS